MPDRPVILATAPFNQWTYEDVVRELKKTQDAETYTIRHSYAVDHDHYREGAEWVGPGTAAKTGAIANQFAPEDAIGEVLSNVSNAFAEPQLGSVPLKELDPKADITKEMETLMTESVALMSQWWDDQCIQEHIQERQHTAAWAGLAGLRLWIPHRFLVKNTDGSIFIKPTEDVLEALSYIKVSAPMPEFATILTDKSTQDKIAVYIEDEVIRVNDEDKTYKRAELIYLDPYRDKDEDAKTIYRVVYSGKEKDPLRTELELGGRLLFAEMVVPSLLTDPVVRTQRQLNLLTTLVTRIAETAAFRERYTLNARPQGDRYTYEEGDDIPSGSFLERDDEGRQWIVTPTARTLGANTTTELVGLPMYDNSGEMKGNVTPGVIIVDPVDPKPYVEAADATRRRILRMSGQGHLGGASNAEASGIAYEQARAVFEKDLNKRRIAEEGMLRDLLTAALALAESIAGVAGKYTKAIRLTVDQHIDPGPRSPDLVRLDLESYIEGVLSPETTMSRLGVEDIPAEMLRIQQSTSYILTLVEKAIAASSGLDKESLTALLTELSLPKTLINGLKRKEPVAPVASATPGESVNTTGITE